MARNAWRTLASETRLDARARPDGVRTGASRLLLMEPNLRDSPAPRDPRAYHPKPRGEIRSYCLKLWANPPLDEVHSKLSPET